MRAAGTTILMVSPTGARLTKNDHPWLPITPHEVAREAKAALESGAGAIHLHVRDDAQGHSLDALRYRAMIAQVKAAVGDELFLQITTEAVGQYAPDQQMALVREIAPECASFALRELMPETGGARAEDKAAAHFAWVKAQGIVPQFLLYEPDELARLKRLMAEGVIPVKVPFTLFGLGYHGGAHASEAHLEAFSDEIARLDLTLDWGVCVFGRSEPEIGALAWQAGGHVRVGFENNIEAPDGAPLRSVAQSVDNLRARLDPLGVRPLSGRETREYLRGQL